MNLIWFGNWSLPMCMFVNGFMCRTFLMQVSSNKLLEVIVQKPLLKTLPSIQEKKWGDVSEVLAKYERLAVKGSLMVVIFLRIYVKKSGIRFSGRWNSQTSQLDMPCPKLPKISYLQRVVLNRKSWGNRIHSFSYDILSRLWKWY